MVDPQHPLEVQAQADGVIVRHESLEAGVEVGGCVGKEMERKRKKFKHSLHQKIPNRFRILVKAAHRILPI